MCANDEAMMSEDGLQLNERVRDSIDSIGSVLREIYGSSSKEEEEEIVGAKEHIVRVTEQNASSDTRGSLETMEEITQLERVIVAVGALTIESVDNARVSDIVQRMQGVC